MTTLYIAGPISKGGDLSPYVIQVNLGAFWAADDALRASGYAVLNPARHGYDPNKTWADYMRLGLTDVLAADGICVLPGWEDSRGASLEVHVARSLGVLTASLAAWQEGAA